MNRKYPARPGPLCLAPRLHHTRSLSFHPGVNLLAGVACDSIDAVCTPLRKICIISRQIRQRYKNTPDLATIHRGYDHRASSHTIVHMSEVDFNHENAKSDGKPDLSRASVRAYFGTRFTSLFVPKLELEQYTWLDIYNPFRSLALLNKHQWNFFALGLCAWTWDALDFFTTSLNVIGIAELLDKLVKEISWGITLVLMLRTVGALAFGAWGDTKGRKWPYIVNLSLLIILQIGTGFVKTYLQFLATRAIFGVAMGGLFGICAADALGDAPKEARGILSGIFQQGYALGYLLAVVFQRAIANTSPHGWRAMYWFSAGPPVIFVVWRYFAGESDLFKAQCEARAKISNGVNNQMTKVARFRKDLGQALKQYWLVIVYLVFLMAGFNFMSHGSQDLYPTMLTAQYGYSADRLTVTNSVANLGAMAGGMIFGHLLTFIGRRLTIIIACVFGGALIYPWAFVSSLAINAGVFFLQFGVQGAWGVIPIHLNELSPPQYRAFVAGVSYQLGNLASSASSTIEATIGERFPIKTVKGTAGYNYGKTMAIFIACVFVYVIILTFVGPENRGADLSPPLVEDQYASDSLDVESITSTPFAEKIKVEHYSPSNSLDHPRS